MREIIGTPMAKHEEADHEQPVVHLRSTIVPAAEFNALWAEGCTLTMEQAIQLALSWRCFFIERSHMDRASWLKERRREAEERYDTLWAPFYDKDFGIYPNATHLQFMQEFLNLLPQKGLILDAACGAGRYLPLLLEGQHRIIGIDQAHGMISRAQEKFPEALFEKVGLQEMPYRELFDGAICVDAMEHVCPEDWPLVLGNFHRALKQQGYLDFTVEIADKSDVEAAFVRAQQLGWPVVYGEWPDADEVYHYYPSLEQVRDWLRQAGFEVWHEGEGDGYQHFIIRKSS